MPNVPLNTVIDVSNKKAITNFCKTQHITMQQFVENALLEQLDDAIDLQIYNSRKNEKTIPFSKAFKFLCRNTK